jgi:heterogeneous nuclear ribonucleoprotein F/H
MCLVKETDYAALRLKGLPYSVRKEEIMTFFKEYDFFKDSIKIGRNSDGTKTGEGAVLFKNEPECKRAFQ